MVGHFQLFGSEEVLAAAIFGLVVLPELALVGDGLVLTGTVFCVDAATGVVAGLVTARVLVEPGDLTVDICTAEERLLLLFDGGSESRIC